MRKILLSIVVGVYLAGVMGAPTPATAQQPLSARLAVHTGMMGAADTIAVRMGYFEKDGLKADWKRFALGAQGRDAMIGGSIDINSTAVTPFLIGLEKGVPYTAVAVNSFFCGANRIVVLKNSDINSVAQLKGKKFAVARGTITDYVFASKIAPVYGLKPTDYEIANTEAKDRVPALVSGAVAVAALTDPFAAIAEQEGIIRTIEEFCKYDPMPFMLTVTNKILQDKPEAVVAYLRGWLRAVKLLGEQPDKAAEVYVEDQKEQGRTVAKDVVVKMIQRMRYEPEITPEIERYLSDQANELKTEAGGRRLKTVPNIAKALNRDLLRKALAGL
jgi:sulfonate transport system substrate-binding protein